MPASLFCRGITTAVFIIFTAATQSGTAQSQSWQGTIETEGNTPKIHNPATPVHAPETIQLTELWRIDGESDETAMGVIYAAVADENDIVYLLDSQLKQIYVVDTDGVIRDCIGREGEGPSEFRRPVGLLIDNSGNIGVVQNPPAKISLLTPDGDVAGDRYLPDYGYGRRLILRSAQAAAGRLYVTLARWSYTPQHDTEYMNALASLGDDDKYVLYFEQNSLRRSDDNHYTEQERSRGMPWEWTVGPTGRVYICPTYGAYEILVHDVDGEPVAIIDRQYVSRPRLESDVKEFQKIYDKRFENSFRGGQQMTFEVSETDQDIEELFARLDGTLWVLPSRGAYDQPEGALGVFDVFDHDGFFDRQVTLMGEGGLSSDYMLFTRDLLIMVRNVRIDVGRMEDDGTDDPPYEVICYRMP